MKQVFLSLAPIVLFVTCYAKNKPEDVDRLFDLALNNVNLEPDSTIAIGNKMLDISETIVYKNGIIKAKVIKGCGYLFRNQLDSSSLELLSAINLSHNKTSFELGLAKNFLGSVFTRLGSLEKARQNFTEAQHIFKEVGNLSYLTLATTNIGTIYGMQGNYPEALEYFLEANRTADSPEVPIRRKAEALSNISQAFSLMGKKKEALQYAFETLEIDKKSNNNRGICITYNLIGNIISSNDLDSALYYYNLSIQTAPKGNPKFAPIIKRANRGICDIYIKQNKLNEAIRLLNTSEDQQEGYQNEVLYNLISTAYLQLNTYDSAIYFAAKAYQAASANNTLNSLANATANLYASYAKLNRWDSAYFYQEKYYAYKDSLYSESNQTKFNNLGIELVSLEKQREIDQIQQKREIDKLNNRIIIGGLAIGIILAILIFIFYRNKQQTNQKVLQRKIEISQRQLTSHTLGMLHKSNGFAQMEEAIMKMKNNGEVNFQKLINIINLNRSADKDWENFNNYFNEVHPCFESDFTVKFPHLSLGDIRLASLIKMKLNSAEIASILNIETQSVRMNKYRLKKKLKLDDETELSDFLNRI